MTGVATAAAKECRPLDTERVEQKFFLVPTRMIRAAALVRRLCRWDTEYPDEQINSLYFDTPELDFHESSKAGAFAKHKVRIRWYGDECDPHLRLGLAEASKAAEESLPVWLELKERRGFVSTKQRKPTEVAACLLRPDLLCDGIVSANELAMTVAGFGYLAPVRLRPVVVISYRRWRFVEPRTGSRVAFDSDIRSSIVRPGLGRGERGLRLAGAVLEVKGPTADLPPCLRDLADLGSSWTRFSKYSASLETHIEDLASVSRFWPSGTVHVEACTAVPTRKRRVRVCGKT